MLHGFEDEAGDEGWGVALHHLEVEAAYGLDLTERVGVSGVGVFEVEVVGTPGFGVGVVVGFGGEGEEGVGLVVHEVAADLIGAVGEAGGVFVVRRGQEDDGGVDGSGADGEDAGGIGCRLRGGCGSGGDGGSGLGAVGFAGAGVEDFDGGDGCSSGVGEEAEDAGVSHQRDVGEVHDLADAVDVGVGLGVDEAGVAVAGVAADALGGEGVGLVALKAEGNGEGVDP